MVRTEYYDDPDAPAPNRLVVAVSAVLTDDEGRILLQRRTDNRLWALPGGGMDLDESVPEAARREVREETGYEVEITGIVFWRIVDGQIKERRATIDTQTLLAQLGVG